MQPNTKQIDKFELIANIEIRNNDIVIEKN